MYSSDLDLITKAELREMAPALPYQASQRQRLPKWVRRVARQWAKTVGGGW